MHMSKCHRCCSDRNFTSRIICTITSKRCVFLSLYDCYVEHLLSRKNVMFPTAQRDKSHFQQCVSSCTTPSTVAMATRPSRSRVRSAARRGDTKPRSKYGGCVSTGISDVTVPTASRQMTVGNGSNRIQIRRCNASARGLLLWAQATSLPRRKTARMRARCNRSDCGTRMPFIVWEGITLCF